MTLPNDPSKIEEYLRKMSEVKKNPSEETRKKMSEAKKGKPSWNKGKTMPESTKQKLQKYHLGIKQSLETIEKRVSKTRGENHWTYGKPRTQEQKEKQRSKMIGKHLGEKNHFFGKHHTEESLKRAVEKRKQTFEAHPEIRKKMSEGQKGKHHSEETRKKMSEGQKGKGMFGKHLSEETRRKLSEANIGKHLSEETRKKIGEAQKGEKHHAWQGGISFEPYCIKFNKNFKERVRAFFDYQCIECGTPQNGSKLSVHHVNFRKDSCCSEDAPRLFVPLCRPCHTKTNSKRKYWEQYFTEIINIYYGGKCYFTESEMEQRINI